MRTIRDTEKTAVKKSNGKSYTILREYPGRSWMIHDTDPNTHKIIEGTEHEGNPNVGKMMVDYQAINPITGEPWQAIRHALRSEFIFPEIDPVRDPDGTLNVEKYEAQQRKREGEARVLGMDDSRHHWTGDGPQLQEETLTDGSKVCNVTLSDETFFCRDERSAIQLIADLNEVAKRACE